ncbi:LysR family transcriptional regulator [Burkholderia sp. Bp9015]|nr:LysR family transcriptional regulator [Burkholderia sp. Bp9131]RQR67069.1 LysR family transcriptional regulator [Burkholderia sp. Bp9015]
MPLHALRAFEAVARLGHVGAAAAELHVTPGAISQQLRNVQVAIGAELFERRGRRLSLTANGAVLHRAVSAAMDGIAEGVRQVAQASGESPPAVSLTISIPPTFGVCWLATRLFEFMAENRHIKLHVLTIRAPNVVDWRRTDVAVVYGNPPWRGFWSQPMHGVEMTPVCSPQLLRGPHAIRKPSDIVHHRLLHEDDGTQWRQWLLAAGVSYPAESDVYFDDFGIVLQAARDGYGIALSDEVISARDLDDGRLVQPVSLKVASARNYHCLCREESVANPEIRSFMGWLTAQSALAVSRSDG